MPSPWTSKHSNSSCSAAPHEPRDYDEDTLASIQREHLAYHASLRESGQVVTNGPVTDQPDESLRGFTFYRTGSLDEARRLAQARSGGPGRPPRDRGDDVVLPAGHYGVRRQGSHAVIEGSRHEQARNPHGRGRDRDMLDIRAGSKRGAGRQDADPGLRRGRNSGQDPAGQAVSDHLDRRRHRRVRGPRHGRQAPQVRAAALGRVDRDRAPRALAPTGSTTASRSAPPASSPRSTPTSPRTGPV